MNIQNLTSYMIRYINKHDNLHLYPELLEGLVNSSKPPEEELLKIYEI